MVRMGYRNISYNTELTKKYTKREFGLLVVDLGEWRPGFYSEFRCASHEHSGLPWGAIFGKVIQNKEIHTF